MHIIFGKDEAETLGNKYTILPVDTFRFGDSGPVVPAFCVIENLPIMDMVKVDSMKTLHENLMVEYGKKNWKYCNDAMEHLIGFWGGEMDTFYLELQKRIKNYVVNDPGPDWSPILQKFVA
jgi:hypothetical protein